MIRMILLMIAKREYPSLIGVGVCQSQHVKNKINMFDGYDLQDAFEAGQEEMKNKAIKYFCIEHCNIGQFENCFITNRCGVCKDFIEFLKK